MKSSCMKYEILLLWKSDFSREFDSSVILKNLYIFVFSLKKSFKNVPPTYYACILCNLTLYQGYFMHIRYLPPSGQSLHIHCKNKAFKFTHFLCQKMHFKGCSFENVIYYVMFKYVVLQLKSNFKLKFQE